MHIIKYTLVIVNIPIPELNVLYLVSFKLAGNVYEFRNTYLMKRS